MKTHFIVLLTLVLAAALGLPCHGETKDDIIALYSRYRAVRSGGCNPWPIFSENKRVEGGTIRIPYDFLRKSSVIFANWQRG